MFTKTNNKCVIHKYKHTIRHPNIYKHTIKAKGKQKTKANLLDYV